MDIRTTLAVIFAVVFGYVIGKLSNYISGKKPDGIFHVNTTDPNKDVFTLELICPLGAIPNKKQLIFRVQNEGSQEKPLA